MEKESVIVLDFGGQYNQLIARRVRECNVYCEVKPYTMSLEEIKKINPKGIIFTGGPNSVYDEKSPHYDKAIFELGIPILGICYGSQLMAWSLGGTVETAPTSEYGHTEVEVDTEDALFEGVSKTTVCWMSHTDYIAKAPQGFRVTAHTPVCPVAAMSCPERKLYATQFHPEKSGSVGEVILKNFFKDMIELIPAIDIIDGKCVRLTQGDYATKKVYNEDPLEVAKMFEGNGIRRLHVVDLDGAREGRIINYRTLSG